ncbi:coiled-coil domain-containing protein [Flavobacterium psychrolimnae]|uniref:Uncharacterized protein n=1 Tax=Flavobacterium psychrolimnae TaxID=249351 RepID=A0A366B2S6_9FLAO|nr:hypothetical protein [Flavobacterium psychrolimnae]RBN51402.1 hypothetical protein DR980_02985 [Flavobacterium psychrolimnae]
METQSVLKIKTLRDQIKGKLTSFDPVQFYNTKFGNENEYNGKSIYLGLDAILVDISYFVKSHNIFIQASTLDERNEIANDLDSILSYIQIPQSLFQYIDSLKVKLRKYNLRTNIARWELFQEANKGLLEQRDEFHQALKFINEIKEKATNSNTSVSEKLEAITKKFEDLEKKIEEVDEVKIEIVTNSENLKTINTGLLKVKDEADENLEGIVESYNEVKSNEKVINSFAQKVQERDNRLGELQQLTEENKQKLNDYDIERAKILEDAKKLIESAKTALNYKTAEGISESFQTQLKDARKWYFSVLWILGASIFIITAILLGIWVAFDKTNDLHLIIGRIALIPLPIIAAVFCANQYVKQKNLIEDYAYKMVLAKSIVGFSEQLKKDPSDDKGEYIHYMKVALEEIHKDPLRKRDQKLVENKIENFSIKEILEVAERMVKIGKS